MASNAGELALEACAIRVSFGRAVALRGVDLVVPWGTRLALLGPNGAGKSTLLRVLAGLARPTSGAVRIAGADPRADLFAVQRQIGVVAHQTYLYDDLTARENLHFYAALYALRDVEARVSQLLDVVGLTAKREARVRALSRGQQQRLTIARALLHDPPILLLDEPDTGLDVAAFDLLADVVLSGRTVVVTTHNLGHAVRLCDQFALLQAGRVAATGPLSTSAEARLAATVRQAGAP